MFTAPSQGIRLSGRRQERDMLDALLAGAAGGTGAALVLHGPLGIGKTALARYAAAEAAGFTVLALTGHENETAVPHAGLHHLLHQLARHLPDELAAQAVALAETPPSGGLAVPARVLGLLRRAAEEQPVLCVVDDAHRLDELSVKALSFVARRVRHERVGVLLTCRDHPTELSGIAEHRVTALDRDAAREILERAVPAPEVRAELVERAQGNPLALLELAGALTPGQLRGDQALPRGLPPDSGLRRAYRACLDELPPATRWLVLLAAADDLADARVLVRAADASGADIAALAPAESAGLVRVSGTAVTFPQPLLRSVAYDEAPLAQRRAAHRCLAHVLALGPHRVHGVLHRAAAVDGPDDELAAELVLAVADSPPPPDHVAAARALELAAELTADAVTGAGWLVTAAEHAWRAGEPHRARTLLRRVPAAALPADVQTRAAVLLGEIELRTGTASRACRTLLTAADDLATRDRYLALLALVRAGEALCLSGEHPRFPRIAQQALALRRPDEPPGVQTIFEHFAALSATFLGDHGRAIDPLRRLLSLAEELDDVEMLTRTGMAAILRGDETRAHQLATQAVRVARAGNDVPAVPQAMEVATLAQFAMGRYDNPDTALEGLRLAQDSGQDTLVGNYLALLAALAAMTGDRTTSLLRLRAAATHMSGREFGRAEAFSTWAKAALALADGRYGDVVGHLRGTIADGSGGGHLIVQVAATPHLVEAAARCGQRRIAVAKLRVYDRWASSTGSPRWHALSARCHALLADDDGEAEAHFREAMAHHASSADEFDRARTGLLFGQHLRRRRKIKAAREVLHSSLSTLEHMGAGPWAEQAAEELRAAGLPVRRPRVNEALTPHQARIARLVAEGATNREVAARLLISTRTVDHHMRNIFAKLGVRSRVELTKLLS